MTNLNQDQINAHYDNQKSKVDEQIEVLQRAINKHAEADGKTFGHVGDLKHISESLKEITDFITGQTNQIQISMFSKAIANHTEAETKAYELIQKAISDNQAFVDDHMRSEDENKNNIFDEWIDKVSSDIEKASGLDKEEVAELLLEEIER